MSPLQAGQRKTCDLCLFHGLPGHGGQPADRVDAVLLLSVPSSGSQPFFSATVA